MTTPRSCAIVLLHPGAMGAALGAHLQDIGHDVRFIEQDRSTNTVRRAHAAGLRSFPNLHDALDDADLVLSVCPPHGALALAGQVANAIRHRGFTGIYVDANAISPATTSAIGAMIEAAGARFVDGGIIGPPPAREPRTGQGSTRLYLSGPQAQAVAVMLSTPGIHTRVLDGPIGKASALKMIYAGWNKGTIALLASLQALAASHDLNEALHAEWAQSDPDALTRSRRVATNAHKAWRWEAEMQAIADTFDEAGLPDGFHRSAAQIYARLQAFKDADQQPDDADIVASLLGT